MSAMGLPDWVCGQCQCDKKTCQDVMVEGELFCPSVVCQHADAMTVDSVQLPCVGFDNQWPLFRPPTQSKQVTTRGRPPLIL